MNQSEDHEKKLEILDKRIERVAVFFEENHKKLEELEIATKDLDRRIEKLFGTSLEPKINNSCSSSNYG